MGWLFYYINHPCNPSFPNRFFKTYLNDYISWDWLMKMNIGGSSDLHWCPSFLSFPRPDLSPWWYKNTLECIFSGSTEQSNTEDTELVINNNEALSSAAKITMLVLVPWHVKNCVPTTISCGVDIFKGSGSVIFYNR